MMEFYHILPSNSSISTYPNNNASLFRIPVVPPYILEDKWEVALMNLTHSNCIDTFDNDHMLIRESFKDYTGLKKVTSPTKIYLTVPKNEKYGDIHRELASEINTKLSGLLEIREEYDPSTHSKFFKRSVLVKDFFFIFSKKLMEIFQLFSDVITHWDSEDSKRIDPYQSHYELTSDHELSVIIVPYKSSHSEIIIKKSNEDVNISTLVNRFNEKLNIDEKQIAKLTVGSYDVVKFEKCHHDNYVVICSKELHDALRHHQSGIYEPKEQQFLPYDMTHSFKFQYSVFIYDINVTPYAFSRTRDITLPRQQFLTTDNAINFINVCVNDKRINFICNKDKKVEMQIATEELEVTFDNDLRDILGFDKNSYNGKGTYSSSNSLSLTRCIQYFYVYSDVCDMTRVGDTKSPLLGVIPFNAKECSLLSEKRFTLPMYVPVKKTYISDILVGIYDDAGKNVPFHRDAITTVRLHFRKSHRGKYFANT